MKGVIPKITKIFKFCFYSFITLLALPVVIGFALLLKAFIWLLPSVLLAGFILLALYAGITGKGEPE